MGFLRFMVRIEVLSHGSIPDPVSASGKDVVSGTCDFRYIAVSGIVKDASRDPTDSNFSFLIINCDGEDLLIPIRTKDKPFNYEKLIGSRISVTGVSERRSGALRAPGHPRTHQGVRR